MLQSVTDHCQAQENCFAFSAAVLSVTCGIYIACPPAPPSRCSGKSSLGLNSGLFWGRVVQSCRVRQEQERQAGLRCWELVPARTLMPHSWCERAIHSHIRKAEIRFWLKEHIACDTWLFKCWFLSYFPALSSLLHN